MQALDSMKAKLKPLGIYSLNEDSTVFYELSAYAEGLSILDDYLNELENECFVSTSSSFGVNLRENLFSYSKPSSNLTLRRNLLSYLLSVSTNDFNKQGLDKAVIASGINGFVYDRPGDGKIYVNCNTLQDNFTSKSEAENIIKQFLPAHLEPIFDYSILSWNYIDSLDNTFDNIDSKELTWDDIDNFEEE